MRPRREERRARTWWGGEEENKRWWRWQSIGREVGEEGRLRRMRRRRRRRRRMVASSGMRNVRALTRSICVHKLLSPRHDASSGVAHPVEYGVELIYLVVRHRTLSHYLSPPSSRLLPIAAIGDYARRPSPLSTISFLSPASHLPLPTGEALSFSGISPPQPLFRPPHLAPPDTPSSPSTDYTELLASPEQPLDGSSLPTTPDSTMTPPDRPVSPRNSRAPSPPPDSTLPPSSWREKEKR